MADDAQQLPEVETAAPAETEELGESGLAALQRERESRKLLEKQTRELQRQIRELQQRVTPEIAEQQQKLEQLQSEIESRYQQELKARQSAHERQVAELARLAQEKEQALNEAAKGRAYLEAFTAAGGRSEPGFAEALQKLIADRLTLVDGGTLQVVENGAPVLGEDGKPVDATTWLAQQRTNPLYGHFFAPTPTGAGGGMAPQIPGMAPGNSASLSALDLLKYGLGG